MHPVTIFRVFSPAEAQLLWSRLNAAGFHAVVADETSAVAIDGYSLTAGGIRIQVPDGEAAEARLFLEDLIADTTTSGKDESAENPPSEPGVP